MSELKGEWTVAFLLDNNPPTKVVVLKRNPDKKFAPGKYTGIGGTKEEGEDLPECASRELTEETNLKIALNYFADAIVDKDRRVGYFWGIYTEKLPPCTEGVLERIPISELPSKDLINTTLMMVKEWQKRSFSLDQRWTLFTKKLSFESNAPEEVVEIQEGLSDQ